MSIDLGILVVSTSSPSGYVKTDADRDDWIWLNPLTGEMHKYNPATGEYDINIPVKAHEHLMSAISGLADALASKAALDHTHTSLGDINFTGTISSGGEPGLTGTRILDGKTLTFKNGLLVGYEA